MYNIKNKIYVNHINKFTTHDGPFIILDPTQIDNIHFSSDIDCVHMYQSFDDMINIEYDNDISNFWKYLDTVEKLRIYTTSEYDNIFLRIIAELQKTFDISNDDLDKILELTNVNEYLIENNDTDYIKLFELSDYTPIGSLYDSKSIEELPIEYVAILTNKYITNEQSLIKLLPLANAMLKDYISSMLNHVKNLVIHNPEILQEYKNDQTILTPSDIKNTILNDKFLSVFLVEKNIDINVSLDNITKLFEITFMFENITDSDHHFVEYSKFLELVKNPDMDIFKAWIPDLINFNFFVYRYEKFNNFILKETL